MSTVNSNESDVVLTGERGQRNDNFDIGDIQDQESAFIQSVLSTNVIKEIFLSEDDSDTGIVRHIWVVVEEDDPDLRREIFRIEGEVCRQFDDYLMEAHVVEKGKKRNHKIPADAVTLFP